jgi:Glycosyl hydrolase family 115/Gylcosyl hydrolase family 115 C-terminal domain
MTSTCCGRNATEQKRRGGAGVYYHLSYWGAPEDFLWLSSISPELISTELTRAYQHGAGRVWMINVGDIKPAEKELTFAMQLAWDIHRWTPEKAKNFSAEWAAQTFTKDLAAPIAQLMQRYYDLCARSKPEHIDKVAFTREETTQRLKECRALLDDVDALTAKIPVTQRDAWYQLIEYPIKGAALINIKHLQPRLTPEDLAPSDKAQREIAKLTEKYNALGNGKWKGMMSYQPRKRPVFQPVTKAPDAALLLSDFVSQLSPTDFKAKSDNSLTASLKSLKPGNYRVRLRFLPNHPVTDDAHLRVTARANATAPVTQDLEQAEYSKGWSVNVLRGFAEVNVPTEVKADGKLDLQLDFLDPDIHLLGAEVFAE